MVEEKFWGAPKEAKKKKRVHPTRMYSNATLKCVWIKYGSYSYTRLQSATKCERFKTPSAPTPRIKSVQQLQLYENNHTDSS